MSRRGHRSRHVFAFALLAAAVLVPPDTVVRMITRDPAFDGWPAWSPDGKRIVFGSNRGGEFRIWVMNGDGTGAQQLAELPGRSTSPKWSPDGRWISFDRALERSCEILRVPDP